MNDGDEKRVLDEVRRALEKGCARAVTKWEVAVLVRMLDAAVERADALEGELRRVREASTADAEKLRRLQEAAQ